MPGLTRGLQVERHQRDLPGTHHYVPEDHGGERHEGHRAPEQAGRRAGAEDEPPGREDQDGGEGRAEEEVPGMEARQRERVDKGEGRNRRDVPYHPEPPVKTAADCSLR